MDNFKLDFLDHIAIRVKDVDISANWYEKVLGLKKYELPEWGEFPIFMLSGKTGVAIFPANLGDSSNDQPSKEVKIDHFAFNVTKENFEFAQKRYKSFGISYDFQDHFYFHSIYTKDPDGHTVELTTIVVDESSFYKKN
jgi:catechol 2,3-dioxygenase-like lactoylglutathione lyase family enzyme